MNFENGTSSASYARKSSRYYYLELALQSKSSLRRGRELELLKSRKRYALVCTTDHEKSRFWGNDVCVILSRIVSWGRTSRMLRTVRRCSLTNWSLVVKRSVYMNLALFFVCFCISNELLTTSLISVDHSETKCGTHTTPLCISSRRVGKKGPSECQEASRGPSSWRVEAVDPLLCLVDQLNIAI